MDSSSSYRLKVFAAPHDEGFCAVALRGACVVGVAWGNTEFAAVRVMRQRVRARRKRASQVLELMAALSEREYSASWHLGLEAYLYRRAFVGGGALEPDIAALRRHAETVGAWWIWPDDVDDGPVCISLEQAHCLFGKAGRV
jgi:hypothetical protein